MDNLTLSYYLSYPPLRVHMSHAHSIKLYSACKQIKSKSIRLCLLANTYFIKVIGFLYVDSLVNKLTYVPLTIINLQEVNILIPLLQVHSIKLSPRFKDNVHGYQERIKKSIQPRLPI